MTIFIRFSVIITLLVSFYIPRVIAGQFNILVIPKNTRYDYWKRVGSGAEAAGRVFDLNIMFRGPYEEDRYDSQVTIIEMGIRKKVDAIVLAPSHRDKMTPAVGRAVEQGIKVVVIDSAMAGNAHSSFIASDNYRAGREAALYLQSLVKGKGKILMLRFVKGNVSTDTREKGFYDTISSFGPDLTVLGDPYVGVSLGSVYRITLPLLKANPDIAGIFAPSESSSMAIIQALRKNNLAGRIKVVGFDFNREIQENIMAGELHGTMVQQPWEMGFAGVKTAHELLENKPVPEIVFTKTFLVTRENINTPEVQKLIRSGKALVN